MESLVNLRRGTYASLGVNQPVKIDEIYVVRTRGEEVERAFRILRALLLCCVKESPPLRDVPLDLNDVDSPEDYAKFRGAVLKLVSPGDYVDVTGGRKVMSVAAAVVARERGAHVLTTLISTKEYARVTEEARKLNENSLDLSAGCSKDTSLCSLLSPQAVTVLLH
ncbi:hypothetical protein HS1genome_1715 [Sulfodiicoccus acidiphilus]|uniref:CRISPR-associated protein n=1 Tax=Sulfodiicoccus acidiphilus TaxID=1670455 RepID=A0A348B574_9CREN|nr:hypothetical protein HS1genome_1715 [Sulfodiicoccus acidiphilus]GGT89087.1 hypothetical protein GCM10007116_03640 [Sulfodiicoccus acidiphilus]